MSEGKFRQPWLGVLSLLTVYAVSYLTYMVFLNPVGGLLSRLVVGNAFLLYNVLSTGLGSSMAAIVASALAMRSADIAVLYPLGYPLDWMAVVVFGIVWFVAIAVLCAPLERKEPAKQPQTGLVIAALSLILAFATFWILGTFFQMKGYEMLLLGTCGFLVFPIWATLFHYWPIATRKPDMHPVARGAIFTAASWVITAVLYWIFNTLAWSGAKFWEMYKLGGNLFTMLLQPLAPFNHYDQWLSLLVAIILGINIMGLVNPFEGRDQPVRGAINLVIAIVIGVALWFVLITVLGRTSQLTVLEIPITTIMTIVIKIPLHITAPSPGNVTVYLLYIVLAILIIQHLFEMHWFADRGIKGIVMAVVVAFLVGTILFFITAAYPPVAMALSLARAVADVSGLQALAYMELLQYLGIAALVPNPMIIISGMAPLLEVQAAMEHLATVLTFGWFVLGSIMWLLIYLAFDHWPWK